MGRKKRRRGVSLGTILMLALTALVVAACVGFLALIVGEDLYQRTGDFISSLSERGFFEEAERRAAEQSAPPSPEATPARQVTGVELITPTPEPARAAYTFTLAAAGTVYAPKAIRESVMEDAGHYDFSPVFAGLGDLLGSADLAIVTLETMTAGSEKGYGNYNTPAQILDALRGCGVDLIALATERALDKGYEGLRLTVSELTARGLICAGVDFEQPSSGKTNLIGIGGIQVAVLAYAYGLSEDGREKTRESERSAVAMIDSARMVADITKARVDGANVVIVLPHWGTKNKQETPENVRQLAVTLAEAGADIILGTHPNVVQGSERLSVIRSDGLTYEAVVCYSLGSLLTDSSAPENTAGMVARLPVTYDPETRRTTLGELDCMPVYVARQREEAKTVYRVVDAEDSVALASLTEAEQAAAHEAAARVRSVTGQLGGEEGKSS